MSTNGSAKKKNRSCLICGDATRIAHLGIDACRACAVFYRRAIKGTDDFVCRSAAEHCDTPEKVRACKRCRFDRMIKLIGQSTKRANVSPSTSSPVTTSASTSETPLLDRVRTEYKSMCYTQLCSELHTRSDIPHPTQISLEKGPFFPADFVSMTVAHRILLTTSLRFGDEVFPEFAALNESERWKIVKNFMFPYRCLEGCIRANKMFPNEPYKTFPSYATYFDGGSATNLFSTAPQGGDVAAAERHLHSPQFYGLIKENRESLKIFNPSHEEFLALVTLTFWNIDDLGLSERAMAARTHYREAVLKELHVVYRETMKMEDYAARLGEMMMLTQFSDLNRKMQDDIEVFRLYGVMPEDNFVYAIRHED